MSFLFILIIDESTLVVNMKTIVKLSISQIFTESICEILVSKVKFSGY